MRQQMTIALAMLAATALVAAPTIYPTGVTIHDPMQAYQGLNLYVDSSRNGGNGLIVLADMYGQDVQTWVSPAAGLDVRYLVKPLANGNILTEYTDTSTNGIVLVEMDWNGSIVWRVDWPGAINPHHDFTRLANGNTMALVWRSSNKSIFPKPFADDQLIELTPAGKVAWDWSTAAHYDELPYTANERALMVAASAAGKPQIFHSNSAQVIPPNALEATDQRFRAGNIMVSQRDTNMIFIVDRLTGSVVWSDRQAIGQHQPHVLPSGNVLINDNGGEAGYPQVSRLWSQALEINPLNGAVVWSYSAASGGMTPDQAYFGAMIGGATRLPNGNTLIAEGTWGRAFEVTSGGEIVWELVLPPNNELYRIERVELGWSQ